MCGIAGKLSFTNISVEYKDLQKMTDSLIHRGPDSEGQWINESKTVGFGHRRLAIIDLSQYGHQPMHYANKLTITFNGEIYNYLEIKEDLEKKGHQFISGSDTEVILASYLQYGEKCLDYFDGMFSFAIWDEEKKRLFIARDRFGEKPLYYYYDGKKIVFASEMKAIFADNITKQFSDRMIFYYLAYDVVENPNDKAATFYKNINQLPPAHYLTISSNYDLKITKYWDIDPKKIEFCSREKAVRRFRELFDESVRIRLRADVPVGSSFSGGIDSSSVVASIITQNPTIKLNTFTARFSDFTYDEGEFINYMSDKFSFISNYCFPASDLIINELDKIFYHQEEPFGSTSIIAQWEVMKLAKEKGVTVLLDGQGADETIAGYYKYFTPYLMEKYRENKKDYLSQLSLINNNLSENYSISQSQMFYTKLPLLHAKISNILRPLKIKKMAGDISQDFFSAYKKEPSPFRHFNSLNDSLYFDTFKYGLGKLLRFADRNSMAFSREVRLPYLSHKLVEFVFSLASEYKMHEGWSKYILRLSMEDVLPKEISWRKDKKGFQAPPSWLKNSKIKELFEASIKYLKDNKYISTPNHNNFWNYLMIYKLLGNNS